MTLIMVVFAFAFCAKADADVATADGEVTFDAAAIGSAGFFRVLMTDKPE